MKKEDLDLEKEVVVANLTSQEYISHIPVKGSDDWIICKTTFGRGGLDRVQVLYRENWHPWPH